MLWVCFWRFWSISKPDTKATVGRAGCNTRASHAAWGNATGGRAGSNRACGISCFGTRTTYGPSPSAHSAPSIHSLATNRTANSSNPGCCNSTTSANSANCTSSSNTNGGCIANSSWHSNRAYSCTGTRGTTTQPTGSCDSITTCRRCNWSGPCNFTVSSAGCVGCSKCRCPASSACCTTKSSSRCTAAGPGWRCFRWCTNRGTCRTCCSTCGSNVNPDSTGSCGHRRLGGQATTASFTSSRYPAVTGPCPASCPSSTQWIWTDRSFCSPRCLCSHQCSNECCICTCRRRAACWSSSGTCSFRQGCLGKTGTTGGGGSHWRWATSPATTRAQEAGGRDLSTSKLYHKPVVLVMTCCWVAESISIWCLRRTWRWLWHLLMRVPLLPGPWMFWKLTCSFHDRCSVHFSEAVDVPMEALLLLPKLLSSRFWNEQWERSIGNPWHADVCAGRSWRCRIGFHWVISCSSDIVWNQAISNIFAGIAGPDIQQVGALSYSASDVYKLLCFVCLTARNKVLCSIKFLLQKNTHCSRDSRSDVKHLKIIEQISDTLTYILRQDAEMNGICLGFAASFVKFCLEPVFHWQIFRGMLQLPAPEAFFVLEDMQ